MKKKNIMEPLSSFAISLAAGIALDIYNKSQGTVKNELKSAFNKALKLWCRNSDIRERKRNQLKIKLQKYLSSPEELINIPDTDSELNTFLKKYEQALAQFPAAFNYIKEIKVLERFKIEVSFLSSIKDTVEDTNKKLTEYIESNLPQKLEEEWKRQISVYKESIIKFKPKTALNLILKLEESFSTNDIKPSDILLSSIEFLKAQCYELIGEAQDMYKSYIKANNLNSSSILLKEKACYSYAKIVETKKSNDLIVEILSYDEYNSVAWAVKILNGLDKNLEELILDTPETVREDWNFRRLVYLNTLTINDSEYNHQIKVFEKYNFFQNNYTNEKLTLTTYKKALFEIEILLSRLLRAPYLDFIKNHVSDIKLIRHINNVLGHFLKQLEESEILANFKTIEFCFYYTDFVLNNNRESVIKMRDLYNDINRHDVSLLMITANSLQLIGEVNDALALLNGQEEKFIESIHLEAYCYLKKSDILNYLKSTKEIFSKSKRIDLISCESILSVPVTLNLHNALHEIEASDFTDDKEFEFDFLKVLITSFIKILKKQVGEDEIAVLQSVEDDILQIDSTIRFYIPYSYFLLEKYDLAIASFEKYVSKEKESRDLFYYLLSLEKSVSKHEELLENLQNWRIKFSFNEELLRIEADLCRQLPDWNRCLSISEYFLSKHKQEESFLTLELISLNELSHKNNKQRIEELAYIFKDHDFKFHRHLTIVSRILIENGFHEIALNILYKKAKNSGTVQARMDYFFATTQMPESIINEGEVITIGSYVKYSLEGNIKFIEIEAGNELAEKLVGHKTGDIIQIERPFVKSIDSIQVLRIMDKYLCLHDEILEEVKSNPYAGFPMQSFEIDSSTPESITETFVKLFGADGSLQKKRQDDVFQKYYSFNLSFTEIIIQNYHSDYLGGYFSLINLKDGITQIPMLYYPQEIPIETSEFIIDFSSLLIFHQISREHKITLKHKFIIAKGVVEYIRLMLRKEKSEPGEKMSLNITLEGATPNIIPENASESNIVYLEKLLQWIDENCIVTIVTSKLDVIRKLSGKIENETFMNITIENVSLTMEKENRILITDDSVYFKFYPIRSGKTISSELYVKSTIANEACFIEFIRNKYIGHTFELKFLLQEFNKKLKDQPNSYSHCMNNTALRLVPNKYTIFTIISFLKQISMNPLLSNELLKQEATNAFVNLLKGQEEIKPFRITAMLINREFRLMGTKLDLIMGSFENALIILGMGKI